MLHLLLVIAFIVQRTCSIFTSPPYMKIIQMKMKIGFKYKYEPFYARDGKDSAHNPCQLSNAQLSHISLLRNKYSHTRDRFEFRFSLFIFGCFFCFTFCCCRLRSFLCKFQSISPTKHINFILQTKEMHKDYTGWCQHNRNEK